MSKGNDFCEECKTFHLHDVDADVQEIIYDKQHELRKKLKKKFNVSQTIIKILKEWKELQETE